MEDATRAARNRIFQQLKPVCIELSEAGLRYDGSHVTLKKLEELTAQLLEVLTACCSFSNRDAFDEKIAGYVFFPLSYIFRTKEKRSDRLLDLAIRCLRVLLRVGWSKKIYPTLATQLLLLLTFLAGGGVDKSIKISEEVSKESFGALHDLLTAVGNSPVAAAALTHSDNVPALSHCMITVLGDVTDGPSAETQEQALLALRSVWSTIKDQDALADFIPGTVSSLTKALIPTTKARRSRKVLLLSLQVLEKVLVSVLSDVRTCNLSRAKPAAGQHSGSKFDASWLKATAAQIKIALSHVVKIRDHDDPQVRNALKHLCIAVLDECHTSLSNSAAMMVETWMTLASVEKPECDSDGNTSLADLATIHTSITELVKTTAYNWISSLPRIVQTNDETSKHRRMQQISSSYKLLSDLNIESEFLSDTLAESLITSVTTVLEAEKTSPGLQSTEITMTGIIQLHPSYELSRNPAFNTIIMPHNSQRQNREDFLALVSSLGTPESLSKMASEILDYMRSASGTSQLAAYWLSFNLLKAAAARSKEFDDILMLDSSEDNDETMLELYSFSNAILTGDESESSDWRLQAIAIEVVCYAAQSQASDFRTELVDVLYPIVQLIGSPKLALREHAMTGLNIISSACGYMNTSDLIVDNVDYMVNAISMRLNTFDISPQAPQVLIMMIRLSGPALLSFLDDVIGSIFAALDNFHGYEKLVEALFLVLAEVVDTGSKSDQQLQITHKEDNPHRKKQPSYPSITDIAQSLQKLSSKSKIDDDLPLSHEEFPRQPWKSAQTLLDEAAAITTSDEEASAQQESTNEATPPTTTSNNEQETPPPTKTYTTILKISRYTQHHLSSPSAHLRLHLLHLLRTASRSLSTNPDAYLPLINDIWPVLIKRLLYDSEPYIVIAAAEAIATICETAGDFLASRIAGEWNEVRKFVRGVKVRSVKMVGNGVGAVVGTLSRGGKRGIYAMEYRVWEAAVSMLGAVAGYVRISEEIFDDILEIMGDEMVKPWKEELRAVLEEINPDAVWLEMEFLRLRRIDPNPNTREFMEEVPLPPVMDGYQFVDARISLMGLV